MLEKISDKVPTMYVAAGAFKQSKKEQRSREAPNAALKSADEVALEWPGRRRVGKLAAATVVMGLAAQVYSVGTAAARPSKPSPAVSGHDTPRMPQVPSITIEVGGIQTPSNSGASTPNQQAVLVPAADNQPNTPLQTVEIPNAAIPGTNAPPATSIPNAPKPPEVTTATPFKNPNSVNILPVQVPALTTGIEVPVPAVVANVVAPNQQPATQHDNVPTATPQTVVDVPTHANSQLQSTYSVNTGAEVIRASQAAGVAFLTENGSTTDVFHAKANLLQAQGFSPAPPSDFANKANELLEKIIQHAGTANADPIVVNTKLRLLFPAAMSDLPETTVPDSNAEFVAQMSSYFSSTDVLGALDDQQTYSPEAKQAITIGIAAALAASTTPAEQATMLAELPPANITVTTPPVSATPHPSIETGPGLGVKVTTPPTHPHHRGAPKHTKKASEPATPTNEVSVSMQHLLKFGVPAQYASLYVKDASMYPGITPEFLAAQGKWESGYDPTAVSPAGAQGISQFMPGTWQDWARALGFPADASPFNPTYAIQAQDAMMSNLVQQAKKYANGQYSAEEIALAGYNLGFGTVEKYGGMPPESEIHNYVTGIEAIKSQILHTPVGKIAKHRHSGPTPHPHHESPTPRAGAITQAAANHAEYILGVPQGWVGHDIYYVNQSTDLGGFDGIVGGGACGLTALYSIWTSLQNNPNLPARDVHRGLMAAGAYADGDGILNTDKFLTYAKDHLNLKENTIRYERNGQATDQDLQQVVNALAKGKLVLVHTSNMVSIVGGNSPGNGTSGHYMALYAADPQGNNFMVMNNGSRQDSPQGGKIVSRDQIKSWLDGFYVLSN